MDLSQKCIEYLKTPPSATELKKLTGMLGIAPRALLRTKEAEYKQLKLDSPAFQTRRFFVPWRNIRN